MLYRSHGRLCSICECGGEGCWFYSEPNQCTKCDPLNSGLLTVLMVVLAVCVVAFLVLRRLGVPVLIVGTLVRYLHTYDHTTSHHSHTTSFNQILMLVGALGDGQTWFFNAALILMFLCLMLNGNVPSGIFKSLLFYLQTLNYFLSRTYADIWPD